MPEIDLDQMPMTVGDLYRTLQAVILEVVAEAKNPAKSGNESLEDIASRFLDYANATSNDRQRIIFRALADGLIRQE